MRGAAWRCPAQVWSRARASAQVSATRPAVPVAVLRAIGARRPADSHRILEIGPVLHAYGGVRGAASVRFRSSAALEGSDPEALQYQKKTQVEHVLHRPDVYVGSMEPTERQLLVFDIKTREVQFRTVNYVPGLLKLFDEILVNAADNKIRDPSMNRIEVTIDAKSGTVSVWNNGKGIPVVKHSQYDDIFVPELVMGNLLAGSNFDDSKKRLGGGRHGYGAKLTNIFSTAFTIETADTARQLVYKQTWRDNMSVCEPAVITPLPQGDKGDKSSKDKSADFTRISFSVDLSRFTKKAKRLDKDIVALWARRVLDVAGCHPGVKVFLNGKLLRVKGIGDLAKQYLVAIDAARGVDGDGEAGGDSKGGVVELSDATGRWRVALAAGKGSASSNSVSYVNGIWTPRGGTHLKHVTDQLVDVLHNHIRKNFKDIDVSAPQIRAHLWVCVSALIENPSFDSQSKEALTTHPDKFGSAFALKAASVRKVVSSADLVARIVRTAQGKMGRDLDKSTAAAAKRGGGGRRLLIPKLEDANWAGTSKSDDCTLILTEVPTLSPKP